ncbi:MAG: papain-like cysteine protease family protein [Thermoanaerobaculia bacterium]
MDLDDILFAHRTPLVAEQVRSAMAADLRTKRLELSCEHQEQTQWCWAAVTSAISAFYTVAGTIRYPQCALARKQFDREDCCRSGSEPACNRWWYLDQSLSGTRNLEQILAGRQVEIEELQKLLDAGRPVAARIEWPDTTGHFVIIAGYEATPDRVDLWILDPWYGDALHSLDSFSTSYQGSGRWESTYLTKPGSVRHRGARR